MSVFSRIATIGGALCVAWTVFPAPASAGDRSIRVRQINGSSNSSSNISRVKVGGRSFGAGSTSFDVSGSRGGSIVYRGSTTVVTPGSSSGRGVRSVGGSAHGSRVTGRSGASSQGGYRYGPGAVYGKSGGSWSRVGDRPGDARVGSDLWGRTHDKEFGSRGYSTRDGYSYSTRSKHGSSRYRDDRGYHGNGIHIYPSPRDDWRDDRHGWRHDRDRRHGSSYRYYYNSYPRYLGYRVEYGWGDGYFRYEVWDSACRSGFSISPGCAWLDHGRRGYWRDDHCRRYSRGHVRISEHGGSSWGGDGVWVNW